MSDTQSIFNGGQPAPAANAGGSVTPPNDQSNGNYADLLNTIKNERGEPKYKDLNAALEALRHSQEYIPQVKADKEAAERKLAEMQKEIDRLKTVEESIASLTNAQNNQQVQPPVGINADEVANLVNQTLTLREVQAKQAANSAQVVSAIQAKFGADSEKVFYEKAREMGMTVAQVNKLAAEAPQAVLSLYGITSTGATPATNQQTPNPTSGSINTSGYQPQPTSFLGKNDKPTLLGATTNELRQEQQNAKNLVEELHNKGLTTYDLTDPKQYFKYFQ